MTTSNNVDRARAEGPAYTTGSSFRARMEARQRRFRLDVLVPRFEKYGHHLDKEAAEGGKNFLHPAARSCAEARIAKGKGVDRKRTFGNMLASQTMCFNLFGPLAGTEEGKEIAAAVLARFVRGLVAVRSIAIEYTPSFDVFRDQSGVVGVDADVLIEFDDQEGAVGVLVIETKLVESSFSACKHRKKGACPTNVQLGDDFSGCRYVGKNHYLYWQRAVEQDSLRLPLVREAGCPFGGTSWQLWANHTLAHVEARRRGATRAVFAVCAPAGNEELLEGAAVLDGFRQLVTDPESVLFMPLEAVLEAVRAETANRNAEWRDWATKMVDRYVISSSAEPVAAAPAVAEPSRVRAVTPGHRRVVHWMASPEFRGIVERYASATKRRGSVYFRPTERGVVMMGLHEDAPRYLGLRAHRSDEGCLLNPGSVLPSLADVAARWLGFESWMRGLGSPKEEERGVVLWLRRTLENGLWLPEVGEGWVFLHHEWRFRHDGGKSDVLAAHLPTGRLGIVELKDARLKLPEARRQADRYGRLWKRDAEELAPLFTDILHAQAALYGNDAATRGIIPTADASLFVGVATSREGVVVERR